MVVVDEVSEAFENFSQAIDHLGRLKIPTPTNHQKVIFLHYPRNPHTSPLPLLASIEPLAPPNRSP